MFANDLIKPKGKGMRKVSTFQNILPLKVESLGFSFVWFIMY